MALSRIGTLAVGVLSALVIGVLGSPTAFAAYNGNAAAAYADEYALNPNPAYPFMGIFTGDDCTNFVSQSLHAGGKPMVFGSSTTDNNLWWISDSSGSWQWSNSWTVVPDLRAFLLMNGGVSDGFWLTGQTEPNFDGLSNGDVLFYDWDYTENYVWDPTHAAIQVGVGTDPNGFYGDLVDEHSNNRYHVFWTLADYNSQYFYTYVNGLHIND